MNAPLVANIRFDIHGLSQAIANCTASDGLRCQFTQPNWGILASYLQPFALNSGQVLMEQGATDRTLYFIEGGMLSVHFEDEKARVRMALVGPCKLWCLMPMRFLELANRNSPIAQELTMAMGAVMAKSLYNRPKRVAVT